MLIEAIQPQGDVSALISYLLSIYFFHHSYDTPSEGSVTTSKCTVPYVLMHMALIEKRK